MSSSRSSSRRLATLTLVVSLGALPIANADSLDRWQGAAARETSPVGAFLRSLTRLFPAPAAETEKCRRPRHDDDKQWDREPERPEGSGVCPDGRPGRRGDRD